MTRTLSRFVAAQLVLLAAMGTNPARADFYSLEGRFACLDAAAATCVDMGHLPEKPVNHVGSASVAAPTRPSLNDQRIQAPPALTSRAQVPNATSHDSILDIVARIKSGKPSREDLQHLDVLSRTGDGRAIELLAWCDYFGIGLKRDPILAYILYGIAALAGVANASANQAIIYDYALDPDQRQMVLDIANDDVAVTTTR